MTLALSILAGLLLAALTAVVGWRLREAWAKVEVQLHPDFLALRDTCNALEQTLGNTAIELCQMRAARDHCRKVAIIATQERDEARRLTQGGYRLGRRHEREGIADLQMRQNAGWN